MTQNIGIIGGGAWGTALGKSLADCGHNVLLWALEKDVVADINRNHANTLYLPDIKLPQTLHATHSLDDLATHAQLIFSVCPAMYTTELATSLSSLLTPSHTVIVCSKGFRESDGALLTDVWAETNPKLKNIGVLTGPSFAIDVARKKPTCLLLASRKKEVLSQLPPLFCSESIHLSTGDDMIGAQIGGAVKNVIAIAIGMADGLELGLNARAALITAGVDEVVRFGESLGGKSSTLYGIAGLGDIILTATSEQSRNFHFGQLLGRGTSVKDALNMHNKVVEGVKAARLTTVQAVGRGIDLPIIMGTDGVLNGDITPRTALMHLLNMTPPTKEKRK